MIIAEEGRGEIAKDVGARARSGVALVFFSSRA